MNRNRRILTSVLGVALVLASAVVIFSQQPSGDIIFQREQEPGSLPRTQQPRDDTFNFISGEMSFDGKLVTGAPYSAQVVTEITQTLGDGNRIVNNHIHDNGNPASTSTDGRDGIYSNEGTSGNYYACNSIHDNGRSGSNLDHGLYLCGQNETIINNVLFRNAASGLQVAGYTTVANMKVYNNVMAWNGTSGIILWQDLNGVDIKNNIIYQNGHAGVGCYAATGSGVVVDHNLCYGNGNGSYDWSSGGTTVSYTLGTSISADPRCLDDTSSGFDAHLGSGSPSILAGLNLSSVLTTDITGAARPAGGAWDLGAYIYGSTTIRPAASLRLTVQQGSLQVRWPTNCGNYVLQSKTFTVPNSAWADVTNTPVINGGQYMVSYPASGAGKLFRLRSQ